MERPVDGGGNGGAVPGASAEALLPNLPCCRSGSATWRYGIITPMKDMTGKGKRRRPCLHKGTFVRLVEKARIRNTSAVFLRRGYRRAVLQDKVEGTVAKADTSGKLRFIMIGDSGVSFRRRVFCGGFL